MVCQVIHRAGLAFGLLLFSCLVLASLPSLAAGPQSIEEARAAHGEGRFIEAARIAEAVGTSEGLALAAESVTIHANYKAPDEEKEALFARAIGLAKKAIQSDPDNAGAHLQLARAIGRHAQTIGSFEAMNRGYAEKIRDATEQALRLDPKMVPALVSLGLWHAEVVGAVGSFMARITYGAREKDALASLQRALELAPEAKAVPLQFALGLLVMDEDEYRDKARRLLKRAVELPAKDAYDRILHKQAVERLKGLDASNG